MIVDFHCHYSGSFFRYREYSMDPRGLLQEMDKHGIDRAVVCSAGEFAAFWNQQGNDEIAAIVREFPERFVGFATVNPWMRTKAQDEVRRAHESLGLTGLVLHPMLQGFEANDPLVFPVVETAINLRMPIYVVGGAPLLAIPYKIADLAGRYLEGRFIMGHAGYDFHFDVLYCLEACSNLWAETSRTELGVLEMIIRTMGAHRLLFGSDYPFESFQAEIEKIRLLPDVSGQDVERILGVNALQFFR